METTLATIVVVMSEELEDAPAVDPDEGADIKHRLVESATTTQISPLAGTTEQVVGPAHVGLAGQLQAYEGAAPCFVSCHSIADRQPALRPPPWALRAAVVLRGKQLI